MTVQDRTVWLRLAAGVAALAAGVAAAVIVILLVRTTIG
jgi:hypothetical protein